MQPERADMTQDLGALSGSRASTEPSSTVSALTGFDPARKPWPLCAYAPGNYMGQCVDCGQQFEGDKRALQCLECAAVSAKGLIEIHKREARELRMWRDGRRLALDELIRAASVFWGAGSDQHNLVRDVADLMFRDEAIATEAGTAATTEIGAVHEGAGPQDIAQGPSQ